MPLGTARACMIAAGVFVPFVTLGTQNGTSTASTVSSLASNSQSWSAGDLLILVTTWARDAARTVSSVGSTATSPPSFSAVEADEGVAGGGNTCGIDVRSAIAPANETGVTCTPSMSGTVYNMAVTLLVVPGGGSVRQSTSGANGTGADISLSLAGAALASSLMLGCGARRSSTDWTLPSGYAQVSQPTPASSQNQRVAERGAFSAGGNGGGSSIAFTGFGSNPCAAALLELTR